MPTATAQFTQWPTAAARTAPFEGDFAHVVTIEFGVGQLVYISSDPVVASRLPAGADLLPSVTIAAVPDIDLRGGYLTGESSINIGNYRFVDRDEVLSKLIDDKAVNNVGLNRATIRDYELPAGEALSDDYLIATVQAENHDWVGGYLTIQTIDTQIDLDGKIWPVKTWYLNNSISASQLTIPLTFSPDKIPDNSYFIEHPAHYYADGGEPSIAYAQLVETGEIYSYTTIEDQSGIATHVIKQRGALGTAHLVSAIDVAADTEEKNRPRVVEVPLLQEEATELAYMLITGQSYDAARLLPGHWHRGISPARINVPSFAQHARGLMLRFVAPPHVSLKRFLEKEVLEPSLSVLLVDRFDRLEWSGSPLAQPGATSVLTLTPDNTVGFPGKYRHVKDGIKSALTASYDHDPVNKQFRNVVTYIDTGSLAKNKIDDELVLAYRGIHPSIHTAAELYRFLAVRGEAIFQEVQHLTATAMPSAGGHRPGEVIHADFPEIPDDASGTGEAESISRAFTITGSRYIRKNRTTQYTLEGVIEQLESIFDGNAQHNIPFEEYLRDAIDIETVPGVDVTNGVLTGTPVLSLREKYVYWNKDNPGLGLRSDGGWVPSFSDFGPKFRFWVFGPYLHGGIHDTSGQGPHQGGFGALAANQRGGQGQRGYFGTSRAGGRIIREPQYRNTSFSDNIYNYQDTGRDILKTQAPAYQPPGQVYSVPDLPLSINSGQLRGLPPDLSGSGGAGSDGDIEINRTFNPGDGSSTATETFHQGDRGGRGAAGQEIVSWGGAVVGSGKFILNGADATPPLPARLRWAERSMPGPGCPAAHIWISDGDHPLPVLNESNVEAWPGAAPVAGRDMDRAPETIADSPRRSFFHTIRHQNYARSCARVLRAPAAEVLQDRPAEGLQAALEQLFDKSAQIRVSDDGVPPSNANPGDYYIKLSDALDVANPQPPMQKLKAAGWIDVDWAAGDVLAQTVLQNWRTHRAPGIIGGYTRPTNYVVGTVWFDYNTGRQYILGATPADDQPVFNRHDTGESINPDAYLGEQLEGNNAWSVSRDRFALPVSVVPAAADYTQPPILTVTERGQNNRQVAGTAEHVEDGATVTITGLTAQYTATVAAQSWSTMIPASEDGNAGATLTISVINGAGAATQVTAIYAPDTGISPSGEYDIAITSISGRVVQGTNGPGWVGRSIYFDVPGRAASQGHPDPNSLTAVGSPNLDASGTWSMTMPASNDAFDGYLLRGYIALADGSQARNTNELEYSVT